MWVIEAATWGSGELTALLRDHILDWEPFAVTVGMDGIEVVWLRRPADLGDALRWQQEKEDTR